MRWVSAHDASTHPTGLNQVTLNARELKFERRVRETAEGKMGKEKIAEFFQKNSKTGQ
jgi:hypothetical protein